MMFRLRGRVRVEFLTGDEQIKTQDEVGLRRASDVSQTLVGIPTP
jgi:hypothetical protein